MPRVHSIVAAGGQGSRFGGETPKQLVEVSSRSILDWSISSLLAVSERVVVALPEQLLGRCPSVFADEVKVAWVAGGASRWRSVRRAFLGLAADADDLVAVHDAARPALAAADLRAVIEAGRKTGAAVLGRPVSDTLKRVVGGRVVATVDRSDLFRAETPQVFRYALLQTGLDAAADAAAEPTDESSIIELLDGVEIAAVTAGAPNPKVTEAADLELVAALLGRAS